MLEDSAKKRVCLFGTSADPPTGQGGHLGIVQHLASMEDFDEVWVLPVYCHMFGSKRGKQAPFEARVEMCRLLFSDMPKVIVSEAEYVCFERATHGLRDDQKYSTKVGTAELLTMLTTEEPNTLFSLALGADTFIDLASGKWRRTEDVFHLLEYRIVIFRRLTERVDEDYDDRRVSEKEKLIQIGISKWQQLNSAKSSIQLIHIPSLTDASSSLVRGTTDSTILSSYITQNILHYIKQHKMYAFSIVN